MRSTHRYDILSLITSAAWENTMESDWIPYTSSSRWNINRSFDKHEGILEGDRARGLLNSYCDGSYIIFQKNESYSLLAILDSTIQQFDLVYKIKGSCIISRQVLFNLKDEEGNFFFQSEGVPASSLNEFLDVTMVRKKFQFRLDFTHIQVLTQLNSSEVDSLQTLTIKNLILSDPSLSWLPNIPEMFHNQALILFLETFLAKTPYEKDIELLFNEILSATPNLLFTSMSLQYPKHYEEKELSKNLNYLRILGQDGNTMAAKLLAYLVYSGFICEHGIDLTRCRLTLWTVQKGARLLQDFNEYREITQDLRHFPCEVIRDLHLLKFFMVTNDSKMIEAKSKQIDLSQALEFNASICSDSIIFSCIEADKSHGLEKLKNIKNIVPKLIHLERVSLASWLKSKLPDELIKEKDVAGRNVLHLLVQFLSKKRGRNSEPVLNLFNFVCKRFPEMLSESDKKGNTVFMDIDCLIASGFDKAVSAEIEATIAPHRCQATSCSLLS